VLLDVDQLEFVDSDPLRRRHQHNRDTLDIPHRLKYLIELIARATHDVGGHGGVAERDNSEAPEPAEEA